MNTADDGNNNNDDINNNNNNTENNNNGENEQRRKGKGRQKISMEKIENETNLQVTFSKRRAGVFKKASELSTLCGAESAVVVFSPGNKPHSFGHPNVEAVANRFLNASNSDGNRQGDAADHLMMAHSEAAMHQRNHELVAIEAQVEREKRRKKELDEIAKANPSLDQLTYDQLEQMKKSVASFKREFEAKLKSNAGETSSWANRNPNPGTQQHQGLSFPAPAGYGYGTTNIVPTVPGGSSSASFGYPFDNFGYTVQYPPIGPGASGFNYGHIGVDPAAIVPYDGTGRASGSGSGSGSGTRNRSRNRNETGTIDEDPDAAPQDAPDHGTGFGGNYGHSF